MIAYMYIYKFIFKNQLNNLDLFILSTNYENKWINCPFFYFKKLFIYYINNILINNIKFTVKKIKEY
jgi:hypothetical protein